MSGRRGRSLNDDERVLWTTFTQTIMPLEKARRVAPREPAAEAEPAAARAKAPVAAAKKSATRATAPPVVAAATPPGPPPLAPLDRRMKKRVARGRDTIDGRLDLHGLTQSEAHHALTRFLHTAVAREARLVLVITGKGSRDREGGVLRRQVPLWLQLPELRALVIGFEAAHVAHGGEGALYVRIRRARTSHE
jgi:DNA-nicking Smr family endonuclease